MEWTCANPADVLAHLAGLLEAGRPEWQADAACRHHPDVSWFPLRGEDTGPAQRVCAGCPVSGPCLTFAMADSTLSGVWGGLSGGARRALRKRNAA